MITHDSPPSDLLKRILRNENHSRLSKKKPRNAGLFCLEKGQFSGGHWPMYPGLRISRCLAKNVGRHLFAGATSHSHTQLTLQVPEVPCTGIRRFADLLVSDSVTDTDVHTIQCLMSV